MSKVGETFGQTATPTALDVAREGLKDVWFEWDQHREHAAVKVAVAIQADRDRTRCVVNRLRVLLPALLRDLDFSLGGRK
jgi:hypothetical protein